MRKDERITIRVMKEEKARLLIKSKNAELSLSEYLIEQGLEKDIIVIDGIKDLTAELRKIGNNINQLTHLANSRMIYTVDLGNVKDELKNIWISIKNLT